MKLSPARRAGISGVHVAAVDRERLPGDEIALRRCEKNKRAEQVLRMLVALERARLHGALARGLHVAGIVTHDRVAQGEPRSQRVAADAVLAELAPERAADRHEPALAAYVAHHPRAPPK